VFEKYFLSRLTLFCFRLALRVELSCGANLVIKTSKPFYPLHFVSLPGGLLACLVTGFPVVASAVESSHRTDVVEQPLIISAGSLGRALSDFATAKGVTLLYDTRLTQGMTTPGLQGEYGVFDGFSTLLRGSGLELSGSGQSFQLHRKDALTLEDTQVQSTHQNLGATTEHSGSYTTGTMGVATRLPLTIRETPQSVSVVTRKRMDDQVMTRLEDALGQVTGVNVLYETADQVRFYSRGFAMDSLQENGAISSFQGNVPGMGSAEASSDSPDLAIYDHVEVLRGASGLTQGAGEPGGTVNLVRKAPTHDFQASARLSAGSWDKYRNEIDVAGPVNQDGSLRGRLVTVYQDSKSFVDYVQSDRKLIYATLAYDLAPDTTLTTGYTWQKSNIVPNLYGVPMSTDFSSLPLSRSTFLGANWNNRTYEKNNVFAELEHNLDGEWKLNGSVNYTSTESDGKFIGVFGNGVAGVGPNGTARLNNYINRDGEGDQYAASLNLTGTYSLLGQVHDLVLGTDYQKEHYDNYVGTLAETSMINVYSFSPSAIPEPEVPFRNRYRYDNYQRAVYAATRISLGEDLKLILGARYSDFYFKSRFKNLVTQNESHNPYREDGKLTPYGGVVWDFAENLSWYASYSSIFKPQSQVDESNSPLESIVGSNYESGIKGAWFGGDLNVSAAVYRVIEENRAIDNGSPNCVTNCNIAAGKVRSQGVELEMSGALSERWQAYAGYTFNRSEYLEDSPSVAKAGDPFGQWLPKHLLRLSTDYRLAAGGDRWSIGGGLTSQSSTDTTRDMYQGGYTLFNAHVTYRLDKHTTLSLMGNNLTDKVYYLPVSNRHRGGNNFYGEPRNASLTATWVY
jgi:outer membrane receptor for ferric coprogen and ferric-rhodotorulic acid